MYELYVTTGAITWSVLVVAGVFAAYMVLLVLADFATRHKRVLLVSGAALLWAACAAYFFFGPGPYPR